MSRRLKDFDAYLGKIAEKLGIQTDPSAEAVISHINNICKDNNKKGSSNDEVKAYLKVCKVGRLGRCANLGLESCFTPKLPAALQLAKSCKFHSQLDIDTGSEGQRIWPSLWVCVYPWIPPPGRAGIPLPHCRVSSLLIRLHPHWTRRRK